MAKIAKLSTQDLSNLPSDDDAQVIVRTTAYGDTELETTDEDEIAEIVKKEAWWPVGYERHLATAGELRALSQS